ncbi:10035_t:CDS:2 [Diversispora eburnea]|uniref:10035_t:CDS:1 n=1 Tax=Diversispora eburnea TaxID=1213867 RepID=A0A9N8ZH47_9GLOM|nr:10035_t:CDS:2 [Diversispora eburnea]
MPAIKSRDIYNSNLIVDDDMVKFREWNIQELCFKRKGESERVNVKNSSNTSHVFILLVNFYIVSDASPVPYHRTNTLNLSSLTYATLAVPGTICLRSKYFISLSSNSPSVAKIEVVTKRRRNARTNVKAN